MWRQWYREPACGLPLIDTAHYEILALLYRVIDDSGTQTTRERSLQTLAELERHVLQHFVDEEAQMLVWDYPRMKAHRLEHRRLYDLVAALRRRVGGEGLSFGRLADENRLLCHWLLSHLTTEDRVFADFMRARR